MLEGGNQSRNNVNTDCLELLQDKVELNCLKLARCFQIEDLALSTVVGENNSLVQLENVNTLKLRKESQQLLRLTRGCAIYFMALCLIYLVQTSICYAHLSEAEIITYFNNRVEYALEIYSMVVGVCLINIVHALTLISLGVFVLQLTRKFKILNEKHYLQLGTLAILITVVYVIPVVIIAYDAYRRNSQSEKNALVGGFYRFIDMVFYIFMSSESGVVGFLFSILIHFQVYILIFVMMWCASHFKAISERVKYLQDSNSGTYCAVELKDNFMPHLSKEGKESVPSYALDEDLSHLGSMIAATEPSEFEDIQP